MTISIFLHFYFLWPFSTTFVTIWSSAWIQRKAKRRFTSEWWICLVSVRQDENLSLADRTEILICSNWSVSRAGGKREQRIHRNWRRLRCSNKNSLRRFSQSSSNISLSLNIQTHKSVKIVLILLISLLRFSHLKNHASLIPSNNNQEFWMCLIKSLREINWSSCQKHNNLVTFHTPYLPAHRNYSCRSECFI